MQTSKVKLKTYYRNINIKDESILKIQLYGLVSELLLSKEFFKENSNINVLLDTLNLKYKDYVMRSRTTIVSRTIRNIEKMNYDNLVIFYKSIGEFLFETIQNEKTSNNRKRNTIDDILIQFERSDNN
ncbi:TPA: hypothetical protein KRD64_003586 [Clostridioides difficile]|uniref:hypothetical protein n=1 Tax=Clostridioides difficile TaxID=1496 RepID=UPI000C9B64FA|nr:hypothetical protein [Clostridioides difficile]HBG7380956.1 hypothetical protein [Clostridioides difficile]